MNDTSASFLLDRLQWHIPSTHRDAYFVIKLLYPYCNEPVKYPFSDQPVVSEHFEDIENLPLISQMV